MKLNSGQDSNPNSGFTLVELLIVIVVIAILASISVVAYSGVQERSRTSTIYASGRQLATATLIYSQQAGAFPDQSNSCFGVTEDFPATSLNSLGRCWNIRDDSTVWNQASVKSPISISSLLTSVTGNTSLVYDTVQLADTDGYRHAVRGFWYKRSTTLTEASISFAVPSDECPGTSTEYVQEYYINGNICSINISM